MSLANNLVAVQSPVEKKLIASDTNGAIGVPVRIKDADKFNPWQVLRKAAPELPPAPVIYPEHGLKRWPHVPWMPPRLQAKAIAA